MQRFLILASEEDLAHYQSLRLTWSLLDGLWVGSEDGTIELERRNAQHFVHRNPNVALVWTKRTGAILTNWLPWVVMTLPEIRANSLALDLWAENQSDSYVFDFIKGVKRIPCFSEIEVSSRGVRISPIVPSEPTISEEGAALESLRVRLEATMPSNQEVAVAISGGVDSALVASLLKARGNRVVGFTMASEVPGTDERRHVRQTCHRLDIPLHEFLIDEIPVLRPKGERDWFWGPQQLPTESHESRFFAHLKTIGFDQVWTGFGADQLMFSNDWTKLSSVAPESFKWSHWNMLLRSLSQPRPSNFIDVFGSQTWDLAIRNLNRLQIAHEIQVKSPFLDAHVVRLVEDTKPPVLYELRNDKPLLRKLLAGLLGSDISYKLKVGTMTASIVERLYRLHGIRLIPPYSRNWRAVSRDQWIAYGN